MKYNFFASPAAHTHSQFDCHDDGKGFVAEYNNSLPLARKRNARSFLETICFANY